MKRGSRKGRLWTIRTLRRVLTRMIQSINAASNVYSPEPTPSTPPQSSSSPAPAQDSVHLSSAALAVVGDKDHDGDSH